ncbi:MAG: S-layer homology domain-containing protein [Pseudomonadota bacterium]
MTRNKCLIAVLLLFSIMTYQKAFSAEPILATGFIFPVIMDEPYHITNNIEDKRVNHDSCQTDKWFTSGNPFGNNYCPSSLGCAGPNCYHPGMDWNMCPNPSNNEEGKPVFSIANGKVMRRTTVMASGTEAGYYVTIKHILPREENISDYILAGTTAPTDDPATTDEDESSFDTVISAYLHIDPSVNVGDIVKKGEQIGTISTCCSHLHFDLRLTSIYSASCDWNCGYCSSQQKITDGGYLNPITFINDHINDISTTSNLPDMSIWDFGKGIVKIEGQEGFFTDTKGTIDMWFEHKTYSQLYNPTIRSWKDTEIELDIFSPLTIGLAVMTEPISLTIKRSDQTVVGKIFFPFKDVEPTHWFGRPTVLSWKKHVVKGKGETGFFASAHNTNWAELVAMVIRASGESCGILDIYCTKAIPYNDVKTSDWFYESVKIAYNKGWIDNKTSFEPKKNVIRADVAKILSMAKGFKNDSYSGNAFFMDVQKISAGNPWYYDYVYYSAEKNIFKGYDIGKELCENKKVGEKHFCPLRYINRAEVAQVIYNTFYN